MQGDLKCQCAHMTALNVPLWVKFNHVAILVIWGACLGALGRLCGGEASPRGDLCPRSSFPPRALSSKDQLWSLGNIYAQLW